MASSLPLSGLRLAVTLPPVDFFSGCDLAIARDHVHALRQLGATVYEFDTTPAYGKRRDELQQQVDELRRFRPDAAIGAPHAGYAIQPFIKLGRSQDRGALPRNPFLDDLGLPTLLYWDHSLLQLPRYLVPKWPGAPNESKAGVLQQLRAFFDHPRACHFFPDTGQIAALRRLGIAEFPANAAYIPGISHQYVDYGRAPDAAPGENGGVAFFGNVYVAAARRITYAAEALLGIRQRALATLDVDWDRAPYEAYTDEIHRLAPALASELRLDPDQSFHWRFLFDEIGCVANGERRLRVALACGRPLTYFGGFADPESRAIASEAGCRLAETYLPYGPALAAAYRRQALSIDVANAPYINGFSTKVFSCFGAGGFMLSTRKADLTTALGSLADAISFSSPGELAAKVDHFLCADRERQEVTREIQDAVGRRFTASSLFASTVAAAVETSRVRGR